LVRDLVFPHEIDGLFLEDPIPGLRALSAVHQGQHDLDVLLGLGEQTRTGRVEEGLLLLLGRLLECPAVQVVALGQSAGGRVALVHVCKVALHLLVREHGDGANTQRGEDVLLHVVIQLLFRDALEDDARPVDVDLWVSRQLCVRVSIVRGRETGVNTYAVFPHATGLIDHRRVDDVILVAVEFRDPHGPASHVHAGVPEGVRKAGGVREQHPHRDPALLRGSVRTISIDFLGSDLGCDFLDEITVVEGYLSLLNELQDGDCSDNLGARSDPYWRTRVNSRQVCKRGHAIGMRG